MKPFISIAAVLKAAELVSANGLVAMEAPADTWCITYLSTYIVAVTNQGDLSPTDRPGIELPSAQNPGRVPFAPSFRPTFARNTSVSITRSAISMKAWNRPVEDIHTIAGTDIGPDSALFTSDIISTADASPVNSESSDLDVDSTAVQESSAALTLTDGPSTAVTPSIDVEATPTSTDIIEPAGRNVIFLIRTGVNEKRYFYKRANNEFVGENNPDVCTFAATFNLAEDEGQLFAEGLPIHYAGEDYKELSPQGRPPSGSVVSGFTDSGGTLAFRNSELPNGEAAFCQDADGQVYITFTTGPSGCTPVSLGIYNVEQCQNGRLVGLDESTSSVPGTVTATAGNGLSTQLTSEELPESTGLVPSESVISASETSVFEVSTAPSSDVTESSTQASDDASSQETSVSTVREDAETLSSVSTTSDDPVSESLSASTSEPATETSDLLDSTVTSTDGTGPSTTSGVESQATTEIETSDTETTMMTSVSETTETTGVDTSRTKVDSDVDTTTADTMDTTTTDADTTTTNTDTTTLPENPTTTEAETTTAEITTTAEPTTTTAAAPEPQPGCGDNPNPYTNSGVTFDLLCGRDWVVYTAESISVASFGECLRACALNSQCNGFGWAPPDFCALGSQVDDRGADSRYDAARVVSRSQ